MRRTKTTRTVLNRLGDAAIVVYLVMLACLATEAMHAYRERMTETDRAHTAGMAIGAAMCVKEPQQ